MSQQLAKVLSYLFHPVIYPVLGILIILNSVPYYIHSQATLLALIFVFTGTYIIPVLVSFLMLRLKIVASLEMKEAKDRRWPYLIGAISFYFTAAALNKIGLNNECYLFIQASAVVILLHFAMLRYWKPSAHLGSIGGFTGLLIALSLKYQIGLLPIIALSILAAGFLATARLSLKAHTTGELLFGYLSGLIMVGLFVYFL
tara:strand:+ start:2043 stop:2645 length:603 start_codon:yes stop_codon:yes gene_type:complete